MNNNKAKINSSCIKIFKLLFLLYENNATYNNVIEIFKDEFSNQSTNNLQVVLNKYMNTLKIFGIKIIKENNKYKIDNSIYNMDYSSEDLKSMGILLNTCQNFPDQECCNNVFELLENLKIRMNGNDKNILNNYSQNYNFSFYYTNLRNQIDICKKVCEDNEQVEILYKKNQKQIKIKCQPKEMVYDTKNAYLQVYDIDKNLKLNIPVSSILYINSMHRMAKNQELPTTVVYKLKNRLAKTYKVKENEYSRGFESDGSQIIINKNEPLDQLLSRIMRYSYNCEIISPKFLREEMINMINETLKNYE